MNNKRHLQLLLLFFVSTNILFSQNSMNMTLQSTWSAENGIRYNDIWGYVDDAGNEYAILGARPNIYFINVTNTANPVLKATFDGNWVGSGPNITGTSTIWRDFKSYNRHVYGVSDSSTEGLMIFDMSALPSGPITKVYQKNDVFFDAHNIYIDAKNGRLYVVGANTNLFVYDLTADPADPTLLASVSVPGGYIHDIFVQDNIAYCSSGYDGMYILDCTDPANPIFMSSLDTGGYNHSSWIFGNGQRLLYAEEVPTGRPLGVLDISGMNNNDISIESTFNDPLEAPNATNVTYHNPFMVGDYAVISSYNDGVTIFDMDPASSSYQEAVAYYDTYPANGNSYNGYNGCWGVYPFFPSGIIIASDGVSGLFVLSTSISLPDSNCDNGIQDWSEEGVDCGGFCAPCDDVISCMTDQLISGPITTDTYEASNALSSDGSIAAQEVVNFNANTVNLFPGFEADAGATLCAQIMPCTPFAPDEDTLVSQKSNSDNPISNYEKQVFDEGIKMELYKNKKTGITFAEIEIDPSDEFKTIEIINSKGEQLQGFSDKEINQLKNCRLKIETHKIEGEAYFIKVNSMKHTKSYLQMKK